MPTEDAKKAEAGQPKQAENTEAEELDPSTLDMISGGVFSSADPCITE
ncbi:MAG TPA: hypothetical protein VGK48_28110 [Terriglobia bacterium]|jgi:hypothetical protein